MPSKSFDKLIKATLFILFLTFLASCCTNPPQNSDSASERINRSEENTQHLFEKSE